MTFLYKLHKKLAGAREFNPLSCLALPKPRNVGSLPFFSLQGEGGGGHPLLTPDSASSYSFFSLWGRRNERGQQKDFLFSLFSSPLGRGSRKKRKGFVKKISEERNPETTPVDGYLGSREDEERSETRYVMRIAGTSESSNLRTHPALSAPPRARPFECRPQVPSPSSSLLWGEGGWSWVVAHILFGRHPKNNE